MTTLQLNAELYREMSKIADDETLMMKVLKYVKRLTAKKEDPTMMTKEEFFAKVNRAEQQIARGEGMAMLPNEDLSAFLTRNGYAV